MQFLYVADIELSAACEWAEWLSNKMGKEFAVATPEVRSSWTDADALSAYTESNAIDMLLWSIPDNSKSVQRVLNLCRTLRIPYVLFTPRYHFPHTPSCSLLSPVTMLEEEVYKAEIIAHLMRFTSCRTTLLQAKDYGDRAATNAGRILTALSRFDLQAEIRLGQKDSMHLYKTLHHEPADLIVLTASREYGLDDILFGPQERYVILHAQVPVMLLNPRGDLFSLCD